MTRRIDPIDRCKPKPVVEREDMQRGRWGGSPERSGRRLFARFIRATARIFWIDLIVESIDDSELQGPIVFHLHPTYAKAVQHIRKIQSQRFAVYSEIDGTRTFTVGAEVKDQDGRWVGLELDLCTTPELPRRFLPRKRR